MRCKETLEWWWIWVCNSSQSCNLRTAKCDAFEKWSLRFKKVLKLWCRTENSFFRKMSNSKKVINQHENCFSFFLAQRPKKKKMSQKKRSKFCGLGMNYLFPGWIFEQSSVTGSGAKSSSVFKYFLFVKLATVLSQLVFVLFTTLSKKGWTFASKAMRSSISLCKRSQSHNSPWTFSVFFLTYKRRSNFRQT